MIRHEQAILRWFDMESRGEKEGSLDGILAELQHPTIFLRQDTYMILRHKMSLISECLGTADLEPVAGFHHQECLLPSRTISQP